MIAPGIEPKLSASGNSGDRFFIKKEIDFMILRKHRMKAIPESDLESRQTPASTIRNEGRNADFKAISNLWFLGNANVPNEIGVIKNNEDIFKIIQNSVSRKREHNVFRIENKAYRSRGVCCLYSILRLASENAILANTTQSDILRHSSLQTSASTIRNEGRKRDKRKACAERRFYEWKPGLRI